MKKKLTLTVEESIKDRAKRYARRHGTSVSKMVEQYLDKRTQNNNWDLPVDSPVNKFAGSLPLPETDRTDEELLTDILEEKYGSDRFLSD